ncbi:uncharacterized protein BDV17DRAFT_183004 [Aspergillus undulatus]|uniref:uncharacterized protein n=1 Tax=Aspergillus undulatus TaxID=1810928 RepID=UPI003CCE4963
MRRLSATKAALYLFLLFCIVSAAWSLPPLSLRKRIPQPLINNAHTVTRDKRGLQDFEGIKEWLSTQQPLRGEAMAPDNNDPIISDVLPKTRGINIFASLTRQFESVESRLSDASQNVTVLAPRNSAIQDLPRKPWENPDDYEQFGEMKAYEGDEGQERAKRNLERFVFAHVVKQSPWKEGEEAETLEGDRVKWRKDGDKIYIEPSGVQVDSIAEQVANGEVWVLNGVINYSS